MALAAKVPQGRDPGLLSHRPSFQRARAPRQAPTQIAKACCMAAVYASARLPGSALAVLGGFFFGQWLVEHDAADTGRHIASRAARPEQGGPHQENGGDGNG